jgi:uncharacterized membrane protein YqgA involved in biofilm formation
MTIMEKKRRETMVIMKTKLDTFVSISFASISFVSISFVSISFVHYYDYVYNSVKKFRCIIYYNGTFNNK